jgi:hypothetical protein
MWLDRRELKRHTLGIAAAVPQPGAAAADDGPDPSMPPPVDPWPHAEPRLPDPDETVADDGTWRPADAPVPSGHSSPTAPDPRTAPLSPASDQTVVSDRTPESERESASRRKAPSRRPSAPRQTAAARREGPPRAAERPVPSRPPARRRPRHPGRLLRFLEILLSAIVLITVPLAAMVLAYSYGTGESFRDAAIQLAHELLNLVRTHVSTIG